MKLLESKKFKLPQLFFITDKKEIKDIPVGVPFIFGDPETEEYLIRILEYEVLYQNAVKSGYPFNFRKILLDNGYSDIYDHDWSLTEFYDVKTFGLVNEIAEFDGSQAVSSGMLANFVRDSAWYVDIEMLKNLNVFPTWLDTLEKAISTNIHNFAFFDSNMYNKKLEGMYGGIDLTSPKKNLIIIDISGSIPKAVSSTCLSLSKNLAENFYADILITGTISTLYPYELLHEFDVNAAYETNGMGNEQIYFKTLLTSDEKEYKTAIAFGDNHHPGYNWNGKGSISDIDGKKLCKWKVDKVISFHTTSNKELAGYLRWFSPLETEHISNWTKFLL